MYPIGFGQGAAGINGTGFQLLVVIFMLLFGVSLGQVIAAVSPSVQVSNGPTFEGAIKHTILLDCCALQPLHKFDARHLLWCDDPLPNDDQVLEKLDVSAGSLHPYIGGYNFN